MARLTRAVIAHRRIVVIAWVLLAIGLFGTAQAAGRRVVSSFTLSHTDSGHAISLLQARFPAQAGDTDQIVFRARTHVLTDPAARTAIETVLARVKELPHVTAVVSPYTAGTEALSAGGTIGFASVTFDAPPDKVPTSAVNALIRTASAARSPALQVELGGRAVEHTLSYSGFGSSGVGLIAAVIVLLLSFGSLLAMGLPIITAVLGLGTAVAVIGLVSQLVSMADFSTELALMIGLGVGIDYALFIVTRFRSAFADTGGRVEPAVELAMATAGRAVVVAGTTVVIALLALLALGMQSLTGAAIASGIAVVLVLAASLTLLPALLVFTGRRVGTVRARAARAARRPASWLRWVGFVQRHRRLAAFVATGLLLALSLPLLGLRLANSDAGSDPPNQTTRRAYDVLATGFGAGFSGPLVVVAAYPSAGAGPVATALRDALRGVPGVASVAAPLLNPAGDTAAITVYPTTAPQSLDTRRLVEHLRADVLPPLTATSHAVVHVGGITPTEVDLAIVISGKLPWLVGIIVVLSALLLLVTFRSLVIPLQAAVMNLLSIGAALGTVQAVFERGWFASWLGIQPAPISPFIPVMLFAVVFGLSMDYEVFLISRIREEWQRCGDASAAVREGVASTGRVITAAAAVMIAVFAAFAAADNQIVKVFGFAMAIAIFLDAIVIRSLLLPAVLEMSGRWTWWLPDRLHRWVPNLAVEAAESPTVPDEAAA